jgi:6-phosphogluconolactonase
MRVSLPLLFRSLLALAAPAAASAADLFVYFGSHSKGPGIGLSLAHFDTDSGALTPPRLECEADAPAFFVIHPDGRHLYSCNSGRPGGLSAYAIAPGTGRLTFLNQMPAGADTSFVCLDRTNRFALAANYEGGSIVAYALEPDGRLGARTAYIEHTGKSVDPKRQTKPYPHSIVVDPTNRFALVPDLGTDRLFVYRFDEKTGTLAPNDPPGPTVKPGSGPRHVRFHPNGRWVYLLTEMGSTVFAFNWDTRAGTLAEFQALSTLPADYTGINNCAELEVHPNGRFLYASNRGHDSLTLFAIDQTTGRLTVVERFATQGKLPRNFAFDPSARWIVCTNHGSNNAVVFRVDDATGRLTQVGAPVSVPSPFCERFLPVR